MRWEKGTHNNKEKKTIPILEKPHQKNYLTTPIGRFVEKASYFDLFFFGLLAVLFSALYFWLAPTEHSLNKSDIDLLDALYFTIVTFTSLGYGDLSPVGIGRFIAIIVVLLGLIFIALLVGKFASERQQSIILLLHTSDCQRRITSFSLEIIEINELLKKKVDLEKDLSQARSCLEIMTNYLIFNANQARLISFGNESTLAALYREISKLQDTCLEIHIGEQSNLEISKRSLSLVKRCQAIVRQMVFFHNNLTENKSYLEFLIFKRNQPKPLSGSLLSIHKTLDRMNNQIIYLKKWSQGKVTPIIFNNVYEHSPSGPLENWPFDVYVSMAKKLNISKNQVSKSIKILVESEKLPKKK